MIYKGGNRVSAVYLGNTRVSKAYLGNQLVYSSQPRSISDNFDTGYIASYWQPVYEANKPRVMPVIERGLLKGGKPGGAGGQLFSNKPQTLLIHTTELANTSGKYVFKIGNSSAEAGLDSGVILGADSEGGKLMGVFFDTKRLVLMARDGLASSWRTLVQAPVYLWSDKSLYGRTVSIERKAVNGARSVVVSYPGVPTDIVLECGKGFDTADGCSHVGLAVSSDYSLFGFSYSPSFDSFEFNSLD